MSTLAVADAPTNNPTTPHFPGVAFAITTSDANTYESPITVYVGVTGDVVVVPLGGDATVTFKNVPQGSCVPVLCTAVKATNTTATNLVGLA